MPTAHEGEAVLPTTREGEQPADATGGERDKRNVGDGASTAGDLLSLVLDVFSQRVVGLAMRDAHPVDFGVRVTPPAAISTPDTRPA